MATACVAGVMKLSCPSSYWESVVAGFSALQEQNKMTDFTLRTNGGKSIPVHKMLLSVSSVYFSGMFESNMKEVRDSEVHLNALSEKAVCDAVDYMYGREVTIQLDQVEDVMDVIEIFQLSRMKKQVEEFMVTKVDANSAIHWCKIATKYDLQELKVKAKSIIVSNFYKVINANDLALSDMLELFRDKDLMRVKSDLKLKVVIAWVMKNEKERKEAFPQLVECIELKQCSPGYLTFVLETHHSLFMSQLSVASQISQAMTSVLTKGTHLSIGSQFIVVGGVAIGDSLFENMFRININTGTLEDAGKVPDILHRYHAARCATASGALFSVSGGTRNDWSSTTNECILFDPDTMVVTHLPPPPKPRMCAGAAAIGTKLYLLGGYKQYSNMSCLDLNTKKWSDCADLIHGVCYPVVCAIGKYIFVLTSTDIGGESCYKEGDPIYLQCYDSDKDEWTVKASPPTHIKDTSGTCAVTAWNNIYIAGGIDNLCLSYSTMDNVWYSYDGPSADHIDGSAVHLDGRIVLCGGSASDIIEEYNLATNKWKRSSLTFPQELDFHVCLNS